MAGDIGLDRHYVHRAGRTARAGESGSVVTLVLAGQRRETSRMMAGAGIEPTVTKMRSGDAELSRSTGTEAPSRHARRRARRSPAQEHQRSLPRPRTSKDTSRGTGGKSRKAGEARKAAHVRRIG